MRRLPAVALAYLWSTLLVSCGGVPPIQDPAGYAQCLLRCKAPGFCAHGAEGWACITPQPTPTPTPFPPEDCRYRESGPKCPFGMECRPTENVGAPWECQWPVPVPTPTPTATPTPVPTPVPTPTPCIPITYTQTPKKDKCENCDTCRSYMLGRYWKPENRQPDGRYINFPAGREGDMSVAEFYNPATCFKERQDGTPVWAPSVYCYAAEKECRTITIPCPNPTPTPSPTPTPGPGVPTISQMGGSFLTARDCGKKCIDQGYLGYVVNVTSTPLCLNGSPGCSCDPSRHRCEFPKELQDPRGSTVYLSLPGKFAHDLADERSDNPYNHQHKPKADETGVTEFLHCVYHAPWTDARCTPKCMDIQKGGPREVPCK
jgi:hypothetical protein